MGRRRREKGEKIRPRRNRKEPRRRRTLPWPVFVLDEASITPTRDGRGPRAPCPRSPNRGAAPTSHSKGSVSFLRNGFTGDVTSSDYPQTGPEWAPRTVSFIFRRRCLPSARCGPSFPLTGITQAVTLRRLSRCSLCALQVRQLMIFVLSKNSCHFSFVFLFSFLYSCFRFSYYYTSFPNSIMSTELICEKKFCFIWLKT